MGIVQSARSRLAGVSPRDAVRLAFRKLIYRKVTMLRFEVSVAEHGAIEVDGLQIELLGPDRFDEVLATSPHLTADDLTDFRRQRSTCIVAREGDRVAASTWMTSGHVHVHELHRHLDVPHTEHFSCRSYVDPDYRGRRLWDCLLSAYAAEQPDDDTIWGLVYPWNMASIKPLERMGWRETGVFWTRFVFGRRLAGERRYPARPPRFPAPSP